MKVISESMFIVLFFKWGLLCVVVFSCYFLFYFEASNLIWQVSLHTSCFFSRPSTLICFTCIFLTSCKTGPLNALMWQSELLLHWREVCDLGFPQNPEGGSEAVITEHRAQQMSSPPKRWDLYRRSQQVSENLHRRIYPGEKCAANVCS